MAQIVTYPKLPTPAPKPFRLLRRLPYFGIASALCLFCGLAGSVYFNSQPYFAWDLSVSRAVQSAPWPPGFEYLMLGVSLAGDDALTAGVFVLGAALILLAFRARREAAMLILVVVVAQGIKIAVKRCIGRPRPDEHLVNVLIGAHEKNGFPSGHTVHYVVFFGFLFFLTLVLIQRRRFRWPLLGLLGGLIVLIGLSRVYLGDHWASDVLAGYLLGGALLTAAICGYLSWTRRAQPVERLAGANSEPSTRAVDHHNSGLN